MAEKISQDYLNPLAGINCSKSQKCQKRLALLLATQNDSLLPSSAVEAIICSTSAGFQQLNHRKLENPSLSVQGLKNLNIKFASELQRKV